MTKSSSINDGITPEMLDAGMATLKEEGLLPVDHCGVPEWPDFITHDSIKKVYLAMQAAVSRGSETQLGFPEGSQNPLPSAQGQSR
jgi:hypothetical protein